MRMSRSTAYAILAVGYIARHQKNGIILSTNIAGKYNISLEYLLKILQQLVRANVLWSKRGPRGGFLLARPAQKITLLQIIEAVDGPITGLPNIAEQAPEEKFCAAAERIYARAVAQARAIFEKTRLSDMLK